MYLLIVLPVCFYCDLGLQVTLIVVFVVLSPFLLYFFIGFRWVFQTISINKDGITFYLFNKITDELKWDDVEQISMQNFRIKTYLIKSENRYYSIDCTKTIDLLMNMYAPKKVFENNH